MKTDQVYEAITGEELARFATAVGLPARFDSGHDRVILKAADRVTLISVSKDGDVLSFFDYWEHGKTNATKANTFNANHGGWAKAFVDDENDAILIMAADVEGVTREHLATKLLLWQLYVKDFAQFFAR